jgi:hypothetical protein
MNPVALVRCFAAAMAVAAFSFPVFAEDDHGEFNQPGNYLIADQFNNRVIEVEPDGRIVWQFGKGPADFSAASIIGCNDAQRVGSLTLMAGTGTPGGQPEAPNCTSPGGCPDNRVLLVDRAKRIVWQYGQFGVAGSGPDQLNTPVQNTWLPNLHVLINRRTSASSRSIPPRRSFGSTAPPA